MITYTVYDPQGMQDDGEQRDQEDCEHIEGRQDNTRKHEKTG